MSRLLDSMPTLSVRFYNPTRACLPDRRYRLTFQWGGTPRCLFGERQPFGWQPPKESPSRSLGQWEPSESPRFSPWTVEWGSDWGKGGPLLLDPVYELCERPYTTWNRLLERTRSFWEKPGSTIEWVTVIVTLIVAKGRRSCVRYHLSLPLPPISFFYIALTLYIVCT